MAISVNTLDMSDVVDGVNCFMHELEAAITELPSFIRQVDIVSSQEVIESHLGILLQFTMKM